MIMHISRQFHIFQAGNNLSSDQLALISEEVNKRSRILDMALENLQQVMDHISPSPKPSSEPAKKEPAGKQLVKKPNIIPTAPSNQEVLKGRVSYKVKGPGGRLMNIAEIKNRINSIYDGEQGIIKQ